MSGRYPVTLRGSSDDTTADIEMNMFRTSARREKWFQKLTAHDI